MFEFFSNAIAWFQDLIESIGSFFESFINGLLTIFRTLPVVLNFGTSSVARLPSILSVFAILTISISIIYIIVGRNTGG